MKKLFIPALAAAALLAGSCSDWTETESLDFREPTASELNTPEYRSYLEALRSYKQSEHKISMITVEGTSSKPNLQIHHPMAMPDSVDFICMKNAVNLHPVVADEIARVRAEKGTRTLCVVDYLSIENAWKALETAKEEAGEPAGTTEEYAAYCREQTQAQLECCDAYGFDGIEVSYAGNTQSEIGQKGQQVFMDCVTAWRLNHADELLFIRGYIQNLDLANREVISLFSDCDYVVILCGTSSSYRQMTLEITRKMKENVPTDRFVLEVAIPTLADPTQVGATAPVAAAWVRNIDATKPDVVQKQEEFVKAGLAIDNAQDDYFNSARIYANVRQAIGILSQPEPEQDPDPETPEPNN